MSDIYSKVMRRIRMYWYRRLGVQILGKSWLQSIEIPRNFSDISLEAGVALDRGVTLLSTGEKTNHRRIQIGSGTYINRHTMIDASHSISIGSNCMIGPFCYITDHDHGTDAGVLVQDQPLLGADVNIEDDVWVGAHAIILKGVTIGRGAIIGAGAVITSNVEPNSVSVGIPGRHIRFRSTQT